MKRYAALVVVFLLVGCSGSGSDYRSVDQCMRREIFQQCMKSLPAGPKATMYNDWDEVVAKCESVAYYQSLRRKGQVAPECRP